MKKQIWCGAALAILVQPVLAQSTFVGLQQSCGASLQNGCTESALELARQAVAQLSPDQADQELVKIALMLVNALNAASEIAVLRRVANVIKDLAGLSNSPDQAQALLAIADLVATGQAVALMPDALLASAN